MHEIGHNLNLNHGGNFNDSINCKPTYMSVMSYSRQWSDLVSDRNLEFSRQAVNMEGGGSLSESTLSEAVNLNDYLPDTSERIVWGNPTPPLTLPTTTATWIDWNKNTVNNGNLGSYNINSINTPNGKVVCQQAAYDSLSTIKDLDNLIYNIRADADWADGRPATALEEPAPVLEEDPEISDLMETPFCIPPQTILDSLFEVKPGVTVEEQLDHFNNTRSCAGGVGVTNVDLIRDGYASVSEPAGITASELSDIDFTSIPLDSDELTPMDAISMRLSRIDSILEYININFPTRHGDIVQNPVTSYYKNETTAIKNNIINHKLPAVLMGLENLYNCYGKNIGDPTIVSTLKNGTADIYNSINKAALGPPLNAMPCPKETSTGSVVINFPFDTVDFAVLIKAKPDLFDGDKIKDDYGSYRINGKFLIIKWVIEYTEDGVYHEKEKIFPKPLILQKSKLDKINPGYNLKPEDVECSKKVEPEITFQKLIKPDGKAICVKESSVKRLTDIGYTIP